MPPARMARRRPEQGIRLASISGTQETQYQRLEESQHGKPFHP